VLAEVDSERFEINADRTLAVYQFRPLGIGPLKTAVLDIATGKTTVLDPPGEGAGTAAEAHVARDGHAVAIRVNEENGRSLIWTWNADGAGGFVKVSSETEWLQSYWDSDLSISASGGRISYSAVTGKFGDAYNVVVNYNVTTGGRAWIEPTAVRYPITFGAGGRVTIYGEAGEEHQGEVSFPLDGSMMGLIHGPRDYALWGQYAITGDARYMSWIAVLRDDATGVVNFALKVMDIQSGERRTVPLDAVGEPSHDYFVNLSITGDGHNISFRTTRSLTADDTVPRSWDGYLVANPFDPDPNTYPTAQADVLTGDVPPVFTSKLSESFPAL